MRRRGGSWFRERVNGVVVFYGISGASQRSLDSRKLSPTRVCRVFWRVPEAGFLPTEGQLGGSDWLGTVISGAVLQGLP